MLHKLIVGTTIVDCHVSANDGITLKLQKDGQNSYFKFGYDVDEMLSYCQVLNVNQAKILDVQTRSISLSEDGETRISFNILTQQDDQTKDYGILIKFVSKTGRTELSWELSNKGDRLW